LFRTSCMNFWSLFAVTLFSTDGSTFRGFIVQARDANQQRVGTFEAEGDAQATDCPPGNLVSARPQLLSPFSPLFVAELGHTHRPHRQERRLVHVERAFRRNCRTELPVSCSWATVHLRPQAPKNYEIIPCKVNRPLQS